MMYDEERITKDELRTTRNDPGGTITHKI